jgi:hypothetical protein
MWINTRTLKTYKLHFEIRSDFPDTSIPDQITEFVLSQLGVEPVETTTPPDEYVVYELPPVLINGTWIQQWGTRLPTEEETAAKQIEVRADRNRRLSDCDWTQVADAPVDQAAWQAYRQLLRDVTSQPGFPWDTEWPIPPAK